MNSVDKLLKRYKQQLDSVEYWKRRELLIELEQKLTDKQQIKQFDSMYRKTGKVLERQLKDFYKRYAIDGEIPIEIANAYLGVDEQLAYQEKLNVVEYQAKQGGYIDKIPKKYLEVKVTRKDMLINTMNFELIKLAAMYDKEFKTHLMRTRQDTVLKKSHLLEQASGIEVKIPADIFDKAKLEKAINKRYFGKTFSQRVWKNNVKVLGERIAKIVTSNITNGQPVDKTAKALAKEMDVARGRAVTLLQTETAQVQNKATMSVYKENEIEKYVYLATLESHTCSVCANLDGQTFECSKALTGMNYPLMHPNCRCTTVPYVDGALPTRRFARDVETGKGYYEQDTINFNEWKKKQLAKYGATAIEDKLLEERRMKRKMRKRKKNRR